MTVPVRGLALVLAALALGAAASLLKLRFHCRDPASEACVWGSAYQPVALPAEALVFGLLLLGGGALVRELARRRSR